MSESKSIQLRGDEVIALFQNERQKFNQLQQQANLFQDALTETLRTKEALQQLSKAAPNESILVPLGAGVLLYGSINNSQTVITTLPGGVLKNDSIAGALQQLGQRQKEAEETLNALQKQLKETNENIQKLGKIIEDAQRTMRQRKPPTATAPSLHT